MVNFVDVNPAELDTTRAGRRGRVSYPIIKAFMERNKKLSKLDLTGLDKNQTYMRSVLNAYITNHKLPIKIFSNGGDLYLMRLDLDNDNNPINDWETNPQSLTTTEGAAGHERDMEPAPLTPEEVSKRFADERHKFTK